jgi:hypothetical protein
VIIATTSQSHRDDLGLITGREVVTPRAHRRHRMSGVYA